MTKYKKTILSALCLTMYIAIAAYAQEPQTEWIKIYGHEWEAWSARKIIESNDGNYIVVGVVGNMRITPSDSNICIVKVNPKGEKIWSKSICREAFYACSWSIVRAHDKGYILLVTRHIRMGDPNNILLVKLNEEGEVVWEQTIYNEHVSNGRIILKTNNDAYIILGNIWDTNYSTHSSHLLLIKVDKRGNKIWCKKYNSEEYGEGMAMCPTMHSDFIITGRIERKDKKYAVIIIKINDEGNILWKNVAEIEKTSMGFDVVNDNGKYAIIGKVDNKKESDFSDNQDILYLKLDSNGAILFTRMYGGPSDEMGWSINKIGGNGYILVGSTKSTGNGGSDIYIIRTDKNGNKIWSKTYGGERQDIGLSSVITKNNEIIIAGEMGQSKPTNNFSVLSLRKIKEIEKENKKGK